MKWSSTYRFTGTRAHRQRTGRADHEQPEAIDKVAYIRFASVYRDFKDVAIHSELESLLIPKKTRQASSKDQREITGLGHFYDTQGHADSGDASAPRYQRRVRIVDASGVKIEWENFPGSKRFANMANTFPKS